MTIDIFKKNLFYKESDLYITSRYLQSLFSSESRETLVYGQRILYKETRGLYTKFAMTQEHKFVANVIVKK